MTALATAVSCIELPLRVAMSLSAYEMPLTFWLRLKLRLLSPIIPESLL